MNEENVSCASLPTALIVILVLIYLVPLILFLFLCSADRDSGAHLPRPAHSLPRLLLLQEVLQVSTDVICYENILTYR